MIDTGLVRALVMISPLGAAGRCVDDGILEQQRDAGHSVQVLSRLFNVQLHKIDCVLTKTGHCAVTAPFERLRTMMMADWSNKSLLGTARKMWASGGFFGLWRGNLVSVVKVVPQSAIQYAVRPHLVPFVGDEATPERQTHSGTEGVHASLRQDRPIQSSGLFQRCYRRAVTDMFSCAGACFPYKRKH